MGLELQTVVGAENQTCVLLQEQQVLLTTGSALQPYVAVFCPNVE